MPPEAGLASDATTEVVTTADDLWALRREWDALWRRSACGTVFQSPAWLLPWWRAFGTDALLTVVLRGRDRRLVGLAPLYMHEEAGVRTVRLIGAGTSDYLDVLAEAPFAAVLLAAINTELKARRYDWDRFEWQQVRPESPLSAQNGFDRAFAIERSFGVPCPVAPLGKPVEAIAPGSTRLWENTAADRRRLELRLGPVSFERASPERLPVLLHALRQLHTARWSERGETGVLADEGVWAFHAEATAAALEGGLLRLFALHANGRIMGVYSGLQDARRAYYYLSGFDPAFASYGLGNQLVAHAMEEARKEGVADFDFLRGQEPYKYRWGAVDRPRFVCRGVIGTSSADESGNPFQNCTGAKYPAA